MSRHLDHYFSVLQRGQPWRWRGRVVESLGQTIESVGPLASVGECCEILDQFGRPHAAEIIGFHGSNVLSMPVDSTEGIRFGDEVAALGVHPEIGVDRSLMGRVLNADAEPIDGGARFVLQNSFPWMGRYGHLLTGCRFALRLARAFERSTDFSRWVEGSGSESSVAREWARVR